MAHGGNNMSEIVEALNEILDFSSEMIISSLRGETFDSERLEEIKKSCRILKEAGLYNFDIELDEKLLHQIQEFASDN